MSGAASPCLTCHLPDCDEKSSACPLRRVARGYWNKVRHKEYDAIEQRERDAQNEMFSIYDLERAAEASEGGRPYKRSATREGASA